MVTAVAGSLCQSQCNKESINAEFCMASRCTAPWRLCIICLGHKTVVPASVVVNRNLGYCAFYERAGPSRRRINVFASWENQPKEVRGRLRKSASSEETLRTALRLKARWENLTIRELVEETGLSLTFVCEVFPGAKRQLEQMHQAGVLHPSLEEFVAWRKNPQPQAFAVGEWSDGETTEHAHNHGERRLLMPKGKKLSKGEIGKILGLLKKGDKTRAEVAEQFGVAETTIEKYACEKSLRKRAKRDGGKQQAPAVRRQKRMLRPAIARGADDQGLTTHHAELEKAWVKVQEGLAEIETIYAAAHLFLHKIQPHQTLFNFQPIHSSELTCLPVGGSNGGN